MIKKTMAHPDAAADKKLFAGMLKKAMPKGKVMKHLKKDIKEEGKAIKEDVKLSKSLKKKAF